MFSFFLIGVSIAKIYLENELLGRLSISGGRDEWMPAGNHLNMYSEACVLCIWMGCQQQRRTLTSREGIEMLVSLP